MHTLKELLQIAEEYSNVRDLWITLVNSKGTTLLFYRPMEHPHKYRVLYETKDDCRLITTKKFAGPSLFRGTGIKLSDTDWKFHSDTFMGLNEDIRIRSKALEKFSLYK